MTTLKTFIIMLVVVFAAIVAGGMFEFFPFIMFGDFYEVRAIAYCTMVICIVIVECTILIINEIARQKDNKGHDKQAKTEKIDSIDNNDVAQ